MNGNGSGDDDDKSQLQQIIFGQDNALLINEVDEDEDTREDRANLVSLRKELNYQKEDLHSSIPARRFSRKMKDLPL